MVAISMEGLSFELGLAVGRGSLVGCAIGGALAMSWTFVQLLINLLIQYGANLAEAYRQLVAIVAERAGSVPLGAAGPLAAFALLNASVGAVAALAGWRLGARGEVLARAGVAARAAAAPSVRASGRVTPRLPLLPALLAALPLGLVAISRAPLWASGVGTAAFLTAAGLRYRGTFRRLLRPGFWASLLVITVGSALLLRSASGTPPSPRWGSRFAMMLRALFVTTCFAAIGVELSHPAVRAWLGNHGGAALFGAVEAAFATLPEVVASVPTARDLVRRPGAALAVMLARLDTLVEGPALAPGRPAVVVLTGERGAGKTTLAAAVVERLRASGLRVGGVLAPGDFRTGGGSRSTSWMCIR